MVEKSISSQYGCIFSWSNFPWPDPTKFCGRESRGWWNSYVTHNPPDKCARHWSRRWDQQQSWHLCLKAADVVSGCSWIFVCVVRHSSSWTEEYSIRCNFHSNQMYIHLITFLPMPSGVGIRTLTCLCCKTKTLTLETLLTLDLSLLSVAKVSVFIFIFQLCLLESRRMPLKLFRHKPRSRWLSCHVPYLPKKDAGNAHVFCRYLSGPENSSLSITNHLRIPDSS